MKKETKDNKKEIKNHKQDSKKEKNDDKTIIELKDVWKTYKIGDLSLNVLKGINIKIKKGEFVAIVGPSGSGKSTLMNQVGVLDVPSKGQVLLDGYDISKYSESELAQIRGKKIGFIFQQFNLIPTLTALENVILPTIFQNMDEEKRIAKAKELLTHVGLGDRMNHKPNELSGGQQQRVAISRSLINNPEIILADEPTGNLDSKSGEQIMEELSSLHSKEGKTIILVTHDTDLISFADRVIHIKDGLVLKEVTKKKKMIN